MYILYLYIYLHLFNETNFLCKCSTLSPLLYYQKLHCNHIWVSSLLKCYTHAN